MKITLALGAILLVCLMSSTEASPAEKTKPTEAPKDAAAAPKDKDALEKAKKEQMAKKNCATACPMNIDPICVHNPTDPNFKARTFANNCTLQVHNCEMGTNLAVKSKGNCPGSDGIKLIV